MARLGADEVRKCASEGWVIPWFRLPAARVESMRAALDVLIASGKTSIAPGALGVAAEPNSPGDP